MTLWPHQEYGIREFWRLFDAQCRGIALTSPTGGGKGRIIEEVIKEGLRRRMRVLLYSDRKLLTRQTTDRLSEAGIDHGVLAADYIPRDRDVQIASLQTVAERVYRKGTWDLFDADLVITDECFVAGTQVLTPQGSVPIENIKVGHEVFTACGVGTVKEVMCRPAVLTCTLEFSNGTVIECTGDHPFFTIFGWERACEIDQGTPVLTPEDLFLLWSGLFPTWEVEADVLLEVLREEAEEPNEARGHSPQGVGHHEGERAQAVDTWRQRAAFAAAAACDACRSWRRMGTRTGCDYQGSQGAGLPDVLQDRHSKPRSEDRHRGRWPESPEQEDAGREEGYVAGFARLVNNSGLQCRSDQAVYNLHVSGHPSYYANGFLVHNCHKATSFQAKKILCDHRDHGATLLGITATPVNLGLIYEKLIVAGKMAELRACGALLPCVGYYPDEPDLRHVGRVKVGEELTEAQQRRAIMRPGIFGRVIESYRKLNPQGRPAILFGPDVAGSRWFAEQFVANGISAAHVDGESVWINGQEYATSDDTRQAVIQGSKEGDIKVVCNRFVMREAIDMPWLFHCILACVIGGLHTFVQTVGRVLRNHASLRDVGHVVLQCHGGSFWRHGSINADREWRLDAAPEPPPWHPPEPGEKAKEPEPIVCPRCFKGRLGGPTCPACGYRCERRSRLVVQADGSLRQVSGDVFKPRKVQQKSDTQKRWEQAYYRARNSKRGMTFTQAMALFAHENHYWPPKTLALMPRNPADWHSRVSDVRKEDLL